MQKKIKTWEDLQAAVGSILQVLNKDQNLMIAAASNPIMALEELGYDLDPDIVGPVEDRLRFRPKQVAQLSKLRKSVYKAAGREFNIRKPVELNSVLFDELKIVAFDEKGCPIRKFIEVPVKGATNDDLRNYEELHPVIAPLLSFRKLDATVAGFCDLQIYRKIRSGGYGKKSNIRLVARLKKS